MSVLDTFLILFESDASDVKKGTDEANKSAETLDKTLDKIGITTDGITSSFSGLATVALGSMAAFMSLGGIISGTIDKAEEIDALARSAQSLNMPVEDLDAWGKAAERAGGDADGMRDSLTDLAEKMGEASSDAKSGAAKSFQELGIALKNSDGSTKNAAQGMLDLADSVSTLSREQAIFRIKELGVTDNRTVDLILKGRGAIEDMIKTQKAFGVVTKQDAETAQKFKMELDSTKSMFNSLATQAGVSIMPLLTDFLKIVEKTVQFLNQHKDSIKTFFIVGGTAIAAYYTPAMLAAAKATLLATWPIIAIAAAVAAFALILDDFNNYLNGNASVIGELSQEYPVLAEALKGVGAAFKIIWDLCTIVAKFLWDCFTNPDQAIDNMTKSLSELWNWFVKFFGIDKLTQKFVAGFESMKQSVIGIWDSVVSYITNAWNKVTGILPDSVKSMLGIGTDDATDASAREQKKNTRRHDGVSTNASPDDDSGGKQSVVSMGLANSDEIKQLQRKAQNEIAAASSSPIASQTSNSVVNQTQNQPQQVTKNNQFTVESIQVNTQATDAAGIAAGIGDGLSGYFNQAVNEFDDGIWS
ncbi:hypothetical protein EU408_02130 [Salmonella enterica subsp. enterica]|uniref:Phage tail tape measure protein n=1 Tax=Salmonella enterica subsp. enterica serovar Abeokuta TaxID=2926665 RepID=A0A8T9IEK9_SALET|nr:hypothetical protein [Salmonella enterica]ECE0821879.1 hypothetical protein [Salmonella enterica subsp. enterica]EHC3436013.1 hypothetical protein [Salmonella enterica subsp. enterica serovar Ouakam]EAW8084751.1 hypothetical protein [Salmonella enterica]ECE1929321.1 hypothetical protein [Salmonella enterica]ECI6608977.1 hypothetical protein [Salmonella enterica subsp. enterica]